jgi:hypothetical protein
MRRKRRGTLRAAGVLAGALLSRAVVLRSASDFVKLWAGIRQKTSYRIIIN